MIETLPLTSTTKLLWDKLLEESSFTVPFLTYEWHNLYFSTDGKTEEPIILHLTDKNILAAFGKKDKTASLVGPEITDYSDIIGQENKKADAWKEILPVLAKKGIEKVILTNIPDSSATHTHFVNCAKATSSIAITQRDTTPRIVPLPDSYEEYLHLLSKKDRHELERKQRKFLRENPEVCVCTKTGKESDMDTIIKLMKLDQRKLGFLTSEHELFFRSLPETFPDSLVTMILYVENTPATAIVAFKTKESFLLYNSGFDQAHFSGGGFYLKAQSIHYAISHKLKEYNFLRGHERYKYDLGGKDFPVFDITISRLS